MDWEDTTFEYLCDLAGVPFDGEAEMDFDGFVLAFEQAFNSGIGLDPDHVDELKVAVGSADVATMQMLARGKKHVHVIAECGGGEVSAECD